MFSFTYAPWKIGLMLRQICLCWTRMCVLLVHNYYHTPTWQTSPGWKCKGCCHPKNKKCGFRVVTYCYPTNTHRPPCVINMTCPMHPWPTHTCTFSSAYGGPWHMMPVDFVSPVETCVIMVSWAPSWIAIFYSPIVYLHTCTSSHDKHRVPHSTRAVTSLRPRLPLQWEWGKHGEPHPSNH